jgi:glycosyltransferase involved in cell wall biosynthesis
MLVIFMNNVIFPASLATGMGEKNPTVSVVIPTYNRAHLINRSIQSVLDQTYQDFEIIVVDDASSDNTEEVVTSLDNERISYIRHEKNKGAAAARNTGIKLARGYYIAFQDSDDIWLQEKLEKQMKVFKTESPNIGVVYVGCSRIIGNNTINYFPSSQVSTKEGNIHQQLLDLNFVTTASILAPIEYLEKVGMFDENFPRLQDWDLVIRLSKYYNFKYIDEPLLIQYFTADSISADQEALISALKLLLKKHFQEFERNDKALASHQYWLGRLLCQSGRRKEGRTYLLQALKIQPANLKNLLAIFLSFLGGGRFLVKSRRHL